MSKCSGRLRSKLLLQQALNVRIVDSPHSVRVVENIRAWGCADVVRRPVETIATVNVLKDLEPVSIESEIILKAPEALNLYARILVRDFI